MDPNTKFLILGAFLGLLAGAALWGSFVVMGDGSGCFFSPLLVFVALGLLVLAGFIGGWISVIIGIAAMFLGGFAGSRMQE